MTISEIIEGLNKHIGNLDAEGETFDRDDIEEVYCGDIVELGRLTIELAKHVAKLEEK